MRSPVPVDTPPHNDLGSALVIGGSRGLGLAIVRHLVLSGQAVAVWSRTPPPADIEDHVQWRKADIMTGDLPLDSLPHDLRTVYQCAGVGTVLRSPSACSTPTLQRIVQTNVAGGISVLLQLLQLLENGSRFAYISSLTAWLPSLDWCVYGATKAAMEHFLASVRPWAQQRGVGITICYPGALDTSFHAAAGSSVPEGAVPPEAIVAPLVEAVRTGQPTYVAPMDVEIMALLEPRRITADTLFTTTEGFIR